MSSKLLTLNKPPPMSEHSELRPIFFMSRGNGIFTPLIPADELPIDMVILGVPRVMNFDKTGGMTSVGEVMASGLHYEVKVGKDADQQRGNRLSPASQPLQVPDTDPVKKPLLTGAGGLPAPFSAQFGTSVVDSLVKSAHATTLLPTPSIESSPQTRQNPSFKWPDHQQSDGSDQHSTADKDNDPSPNGDSLGKYNVKPTSKSADLDISKSSSSLGDQAVIDAIASTAKTTGRASSSNRAYKRQGSQGPIRGPLKDDSKTYCSYWVRHGECDYTQQGCRFLHEMPQDREALTKIGLRDFPRWWKELNALNVGTWRHQGRNAKSQSAGSSQPSSLASGTSSNTDVTTADAPETAVVGLSKIEKKLTTGAASDASEQMRLPVTTPPRSSTIHQRPPHTRYRGSPSSTASSDSSTSSPEAQYSRFIPGNLHPQTRALRVQRLMGRESTPEGGVRVQKGVTEGQKAGGSNPGNVVKSDRSILIELEGLSVT